MINMFKRNLKVFLLEKIKTLAKKCKKIVSDHILKATHAATIPKGSHVNEPKFYVGIETDD